MPIADYYSLTRLEFDYLSSLHDDQLFNSFGISNKNINIKDKAIWLLCMLYLRAGEKSGG